MNIYNISELTDALKLASKTNAPIILSGNVLRSEFKGGFVDVTLTEVLIDENFQIVLTKELQDWLKQNPAAEELTTKREGKHVTIKAGTSKQMVDVCETRFSELLTPDFETSVKGPILAEGFRLSALSMKAAPSAKKERICFAKNNDCGCYQLFGVNINLRWKTRVPFEQEQSGMDADFICPLTPAQCSIAGKFCSLLSTVQIRPNQEGVILSSGMALIQLEWADTYGWLPPQVPFPSIEVIRESAVLDRKEAAKTFSLAERMSKYGLSFKTSSEKNDKELKIECKTASGMFIASWSMPLVKPFAESRFTPMKPHLALPLIKAAQDEHLFLNLSDNEYESAVIITSNSFLEIK